MLRIGVIFLRHLNPEIIVGGREALTLWLIQALQSRHQVTLLHLDEKIDFDELNKVYGTKLIAEKIKLLRIPKNFPLPPKFWLLKQSLLFKKVKPRVSNFDVVISAQGEIDAGRPVVQYIHDPASSLFFIGKKPHFIKDIYRDFCKFIYKRSLESMKKNLTLTNSFYTAKLIKSIYGVSARVVYPPVPPVFIGNIPWKERENGFILISRISPEKNIEKVIEIIKKVREYYRDFHLHILGPFQDRDYGKYIWDIINKNKEWIFYEGVLPRNQYFSLISKHKYGIHGKPDEHFGIGIAEMVKAGLIVFVPSEGGQVEIVGNEYLIYSSKEEAISKILKVIQNAFLQKALRNELKNNARKFSVENFSQEIVKIVEDFANSRK